MANVRGYAERMERRENNKRKKIGTDDGKKPTIFDCL